MADLVLCISIPFPISFLRAPYPGSLLLPQALTRAFEPVKPEEGWQLALQEAVQGRTWAAAGGRPRVCEQAGV